MEKSGNKEELLIWLETIPDDFYHVIIVKDKERSLNQLYAIIRKSKPHGVKFEDWKQTVKDKHGLFFYEEGERVYRSFKKLTHNEIEHIVNLES